MNRRDFLRAALGVAIVGGFAPEVLAQVARIPPASTPGNYDHFIKDYLYKIRNFDAHHQEDVCLNQAQSRLFYKVRSLTPQPAFGGRGMRSLVQFNDERWSRFHSPATISTKGYH